MDEIKIKPNYKHRVLHMPTKVHRDKKKYTRKGRLYKDWEKEVMYGQVIERN